MAQGTVAGLAWVDALDPDSILTGYHLLHGVRGDLLLKVGRIPEASKEIQRAIAMTENRRERGLPSEN